MQVAARPYLAAGVALFGASAIAISPVAPPMPDITVPAISSAAVNLSAATDPIQAYVTMFTTIFENGSALIEKELADPAPILQQVVANQVDSITSVAGALQTLGESLAKSLDPSNPFGIPARFQVAFEQLMAGNVNQAVATAWGAVLGTALGALPILPAIQGAIEKPFGNLDKVLKDQSLVPLLAIGMLVPVYNTLTAAGNIGQDIVDSVQAGDPLGVVNTLISSPAIIGNALIGNGLLDGAGPLAMLRIVRDAIASDITPPAPAPTATLAAAPEAGAATVTLDVAPQSLANAPVAAQAAAAPVESAPAAEDSAAADTSSNVTTPVVRDSLKAEPGKTLSTKRSTSAKQVREGVQGAVKSVTDGLKKAAEGLSGKSSTKTSTGGASSSDAGASSHDAA